MPGRWIRKPTGDTTVVFIHGVLSSGDTAWKHANGTDWPVLLGDDPKTAGRGVYVYSYHTGFGSGGYRIGDIVDALKEELALDEVTASRRLVLVCHSMGGIVARKYLVERVVDLLDGGKEIGLFLVASPSLGSDYAAWLAPIAKKFGHAQADALRFAGDNPWLADLDKEFINLKEGRRLPLQGKELIEDRFIDLRVPFLWLFWRKQIVEPFSGARYFGEPLKVPASDHGSIAKPDGAEALQHRLLMRFLTDHFPTDPPKAPPPPPGPTPSDPPPPAGPPPGRLLGGGDVRLAPREGRLFGRADDVARIVAFLRDPGVAAAHVTGIGGTGKTEVCKAALREWLAGDPGATAYYVEVPEQGSAAALVDRLGRALGVENVGTVERLARVMPPGLYYLDNMESVLDGDEGRVVVRALRTVPGVRLLASSRVDAAALFGKPIALDVLPGTAAVELFRHLWAGQDALPDTPEVSLFVEHSLGSHALTVVLTARLGDSYAFPALVQRWRTAGPGIARDTTDDSRFGSLTVSLGLTRDALAPLPGALPLWTLAALFPGGIPEEALLECERRGGWSEDVRLRLIRHHVLTRLGTRYRMLPSVARYALDLARDERDGFSWAASRPVAAGLFGDLAKAADDIRSSAPSLEARARLYESFPALHRHVDAEAASAAPDLEALDRLNDHLRNRYQFRPAISHEILRTLARILPKPAMAVLIRAEMEQYLGRIGPARLTAEEALRLFAADGVTFGQAQATFLLGRLAAHCGDVADARRHYGAALALFRDAEDALGQANTFYALGSLEYRLGHPGAARAAFKDALALSQAEGDPLGEANVRHGLGWIAAEDEDAVTARREYEIALRLYGEERSDTGVANTRAAMGILSERAGAFDEAREHYRAAAELSLAAESSIGVANAKRALALLEALYGDAVESRRFADEAVPLFRANEDALGESTVEWVYGRLALRDGRPADAERHFRKALDRQTAEGIPGGIATAQLGIALALAARGDRAGSDAALVEARRAAAASGSKFLVGFVEREAQGAA